jgi:hypothetical protein
LFSGIEHRESVHKRVLSHDHRQSLADFNHGSASGKIMSLFDTLADSITPDARNAMILLEEESRQVNTDRALALLRQVVTSPIRYEILREGYPAVVLIRLEREQVREAVLKLSANGFTKLKAVDPRRQNSKV